MMADRTHKLAKSVEHNVLSMFLCMINLQLQVVMSVVQQTKAKQRLGHQQKMLDATMNFDNIL